MSAAAAAVRVASRPVMPTRAPNAARPTAVADASGDAGVEDVLASHAWCAAIADSLPGEGPVGGRRLQ